MKKEKIQVPSYILMINYLRIYISSIAMLVFHRKQQQPQTLARNQLADILFRNLKNDMEQKERKYLSEKVQNEMNVA